MERSFFLKALLGTPLILKTMNKVEKKKLTESENLIKEKDPNICWDIYSTQYGMPIDV